MFKGPILNQKLLEVIAGLGHTDKIAILDAGCPRPDNAVCVDLAITQDVPTIEMALELITRAMIYEKAEVAEGQAAFNPELHNKICSLIKRCDVDIVDTDLMMDKIRKECKAVVRTGAYQPWGNIILTCGVDAPKWFNQKGVVIPDFYKERAAYSGD
jgi:D-ribose pyranase